MRARGGRGFRRRRKNRLPGRFRAFPLMYCVQNVIFVKNATLDASAAARTAENEPEEVYLRFRKGKAVPFENARECTSGRHVGAFS